LSLAARDILSALTSPHCVREQREKTVPFKILVVDDEPDFEPLMLQYFKRQIQCGETVLSFARSGIEALEQLRGDPEVSIVLSDINMPRMDGLALLTQIGALGLFVKVIIISAYGDMGNIRAAMNLGAFDFLTKPIDFLDLDVTVAKAKSHVQELQAARRLAAERAALQEQLIEAQRDAIRSLSTPLLPISKGVVALPLIGRMDGARAHQMIEVLLQGIIKHQARHAIVDITGVAVMDQQVADALGRAARAVQLLGAEIVLTGIQPQIARELIELGVDLGGIATESTLEDGIASALRRKGGRRAPVNPRGSGAGSSGATGAT
jgi:anti-anti-sigma regulatory factor/FixJ family two-component response regulator